MVYLAILIGLAQSQSNAKVVPLDNCFGQCPSSWENEKSIDNVPNASLP